jgi:hypothetical protein
VIRWIVVRSRLRPGRLVAGGVDDDPPQPSLERAGTPIALPETNRLRKGVLNRVGGQVDIARDRRSDVQEASVVAAIDGFDLRQAGLLLLCHDSLTGQDDRFL